MRKKVLFCATVINHIQVFHLPYLNWLQEKGWEVHVAANGEANLPYVDKLFNIPIQREPNSIKNFKAYKELKKIMEENQYSIIHCHTPVGGVLARLAAKKFRKKGTKVIYTAHGFHFYKGAPLKNWMIFYPVERVLAGLTDCLVTINYEDYQRAVKDKFKAKKINYSNGIGIDVNKFTTYSDQEKGDLRKIHGFNELDFLLVYVAELNKNKNQLLLLEVIQLLKEKVPNIKLLLLGSGDSEDYYKEQATTSGISDNVKFLGYRTDVSAILPMCDVAVASSFREGLPVNILEAMASGLPVVATDNRGHRQLVEDEVNGFLVYNNSAKAFAEKLLYLYVNRTIREKMGTENLSRVKEYSIDSVLQKFGSVYS